MRKIALIFGTRPEAIKLCPLVQALRVHPEFEPHVCVTAQHRSMLDQVLEVFGIVPDADLNLMQPGQTLSGLASRAMAALDQYLLREEPDLVLVQGDTTTVLCAALAAFHRQIPVGHVEAGLRTWNRQAPFPEEMNRTLTSRLADWHFAPTEWARGNLLQEGIAPDRVFVTGNTVLDALRLTLATVRCDALHFPGLPAPLFSAERERPLVLITGHRRENFGAGFEAICDAVVRLSEAFPETVFVYPVHLNPQVQGPVRARLGGRRNIYLIEPLAYAEFVVLMERSTLVLTDSGGVQEEAPSLGKPVLVMRETTERPEAVEAGTARLVGTDPERIFGAVSELLNDPTAYDKMARATNPYGDGHACERIVKILAEIAAR
ncbi:MAG TPA: UDP-N-acetylglucosamine 2-epimerase (non-hydrolyzing) [Candidatus Sumerlaeota bacterium]|nr:UDP-N-acetylglucosamine 2-epimerase (non-hydrolyzing) [Candidatus Sumerlaeota bacterium]